MARRRKGLPINGWLIFDKPQGMTSTQAVARVKRLYDAAKAGHAGTLDPLATGVLPIALGEATKTVPFVVEGSKEYRFTVRFGVETDTDDAMGKMVAGSDQRPTAAQIEAKLPDFTGEIDQ
ncbi:MAG: tRNA pseudouridine(55) synthase TruB, partial [Methyloceanibacter sp.]|nr:tRNA pseudouridine(55) synthase TruB [Methyloceanibacter sp.]